ncbi:glutamate ABC transporter substrate-binding protein [Streptomyces sp. NPDC048659]|uniref:glutamate ABC transporter substrate-binding protein n=1 Tax=Streptomyces sp. NPDC048659 TaxID=3155489 RepID=UPI00341418D9
MPDGITHTDPAGPAEDPTGLAGPSSGAASGPGAVRLTARRVAGRLRGWGGVAAMATVCALTASLTLLSLPHASPGAAQGPVTGPGVGVGVQVRAGSGESADECRRPEASLTPSSADGPAVAAIKQRGKLIVGVDQNSYRWGYRTPATTTVLPDGRKEASPGRLVGFDIDLARAIAKDILGDEDAIVFRTIPTNQRIAALESRKVDLVVRTMTINCKRIQQVSFSTAYFQVGQQILAPKDSEITGYDTSLSGKRVCTAEGSTAYEELEEKSFGAVYKDVGDGTKDDPDLLTVPNQLDCLARLQMGEVDAVLTDNALGAGQAAQDPAVELKGKPFTTEYYGVAAKLGDDDLVRRVNKVLVDYRQGPWQKAYETWLKADLPGISGPPAPTYK